jgi:hypothetical protein
VAARSTRLLAHTWIYVPAVCGPVSGGLIKLDGGSTVAAVVMGVAPYVVWLLLLGVFVIGYLAALTRCQIPMVRAGGPRRDGAPRSDHS